jgi:hypothetical protein
MKFDFPRRVRTFHDYVVERDAFQRYNSRKVKTFFELFCVQAGFTTVKSEESFDFPRIILRKGMSFRRIIYEKSKLSANHTAERRPFRRIIRGK